MMRGIDVSNWQAGLVPSELGIDFCIAKATEGTNFVDSYCDGFVQNCIEHDILWGFYHFARENEPEEEAEFFVENCTGYFGKRSWKCTIYRCAAGSNTIDGRVESKNSTKHSRCKHDCCKN